MVLEEGEAMNKVRYFKDLDVWLFKIDNFTGHIWSKPKNKWIERPETLDAPFDITEYDELSLEQAVDLAKKIGARL